MVKGQRELVLGLSRDPQFGPCVMLGLGGVLTKVLNDTAFRAAPFGILARRLLKEKLSGKETDPIRLFRTARHFLTFQYRLIMVATSSLFCLFIR
jgi:hypothetical protein